MPQHRRPLRLPPSWAKISTATFAAAAAAAAGALLDLGPLPVAAIVTPPSIFSDVFSNPKFRVLFGPAPLEAPPTAAPFPPDQTPPGIPAAAAQDAPMSSSIEPFSAVAAVDEPKLENQAGGAMVIAIPSNGRLFKCYLPSADETETSTAIELQAEADEASSYENEQRIIKAGLEALDEMRTQKCIHNFHPRTPQEERAHPEKRQDYIMGYHPHMPQSERVPGHPVPAGSTTSPATPVATLVEYDVDGQVAHYLSQLWENGTPCEVGDSAPRSTEIRFHCSPYEGLAQVREIGSCRYIVVYHTPRLCSIPEFVIGATSKSDHTSSDAILPSSAVRCHPVGEDDARPAASEPAADLVPLNMFAKPQPSSPHALLTWRSDPASGAGAEASASNPQPSTAEPSTPGAMTLKLEDGMALSAAEIEALLHAIEDAVPLQLAFSNDAGAEAAAAAAGAEGGEQQQRQQPQPIDFMSLMRKILGDDAAVFGEDGGPGTEAGGQGDEEVGGAGTGASEPPPPVVMAKVKVVVVDEDGNVLERLDAGDHIVGGADLGDAAAAAAAELANGGGAGFAGLIKDPEMLGEIRRILDGHAAGKAAGGGSDARSPDDDDDEHDGGFGRGDGGGQE
ncbi:Protein OS-9 [Cladochytrium tenue]|nr:Protein OS-9 [Cladochytrium tenue]